MSNLISDIVIAVIGVVVPILATYFANWLKTKIGAETLAEIQRQIEIKNGLAYTAVKFVEQVYTDLHGYDKYNKAVEWLTTQLDNLGLDYTEDELKGLIESALRQIKDTLGENWANTSKS